MRCWKCDRNCHESFECPRRERRKKNRHGDAYKAQEAARAFDDFDGSESVGSPSDSVSHQ